MKSNILILAFLFLGVLQTQAQTANNRVSPLDSIETQLNDLEIEIIYSRPYLKGRQFGKDIVPFGKVWRTGANEATIFQIDQDAMIEGKILPAGKYSLYTIPDEHETIVIFNKDWDQWGTKYDEKQDALRVMVPTFTSEEPVEQFTIDLDESGAACLTWGNTLFTFHIKESNS